MTDTRQRVNSVLKLCPDVKDRKSGKARDASTWIEEFAMGLREHVVVHKILSPSPVILWIELVGQSGKTASIKSWIQWSFVHQPYLRLGVLFAGTQTPTHCNSNSSLTVKIHCSVSTVKTTADHHHAHSFLHKKLSVSSFSLCSAADLDIDDLPGR